MGYNRENYYLLAVDKESDFLYSIPSVERANTYLLLKEYLNATGFRPLRLRCDNAPEFTSSDFVAFCESSHISIQYVESYNHTMNGRIENCVKIVKSHVRAALSASNVPRNFWPDCTKDLVNKYNNLVKRTSTGQLLTPFERVKPKNLSNRLPDVFVPFGCKAVGILPKEHPLITNTSHQNRGYEGIFLCKHDHSEQVWLYVFALRKRMLFHDVFAGACTLVMEAKSHISPGFRHSRTDCVGLHDSHACSFEGDRYEPHGQCLDGGHPCTARRK